MTATSSPTSSLTTELREDLRSYADLGGLTLTADTHAWYAGVDTISTPEEARAASTVLAELRGRDLPAVREAASSLVGAPGTVGETGRAVALLIRVRRTLAALGPQAYETEDLDELIAATANGAWRKERGVKVPLLRRRSLRGRARGLASSRWARSGALHAALTAAAEDRTKWAALAGADAGAPALPDDAELINTAAEAVQATSTGLAALGKLLQPERDLEALAFDDLADLLDRLAADEGTLYRLPALRSLRDRLPAEGLDALYAELTAAEAAAEPVVEPVVEAVTVPEPRAEEPVAEAVAEPEPVEEPVAEVVAEPVVVSEPEPEPVVEVVTEPEPEPVAVVEAAPAPELAPEPEPVAVPQPRRPRRPRKPSITVGKPVTAYSPEELTAVVRWIDTDGEKRTDDELLRAAMKELGFARIGPRIKEALGAAVSEVRG
ncbi:hypothetical protein OG607_19885 [Streptomyces sp. NBC_01537]|uniref:hypothetical protein n=1 Tax=Streptomyces sp. NBC_01537 TaxID=2903896 RepID=UPI00386DA320